MAAGVYICDFGNKNGVHTYRVNGEKKDLEKIINELEEENAEFAEVPNIETAHKHFTMLLKLKIKEKAKNKTQIEQEKTEVKETISADK